MHKSRHLLRTTLAIFAICLVAPLVSAQSGGVFIQPQTPVKIAPDEGTLAFERPTLDFAAQSIGPENCANVSLTNTTDHPRLLTSLRSLDPRHFSISSPSNEMLPITVGANTSFYINVCFKAEELKSYSSAIVAVFQSDTVRLSLSGRGVTPPEVEKLPTDAAITDIKHKKNKWTFRFGLKNRSYVKLTLENLAGKTVKNFPFEALKTPGYYEAEFAGLGDDGKKLEHGNYILRLEASDPTNGSRTHSSKMVKL